MTTQQIENRLNYLVEKNMFFCFNSNGSLFTADELLTKKLGRVVEIDEAAEYIKEKRRENFIKKLTKKI